MKPQMLLGVAALALVALSAPQIAGAATNAAVSPGLDMPPSAVAAWDDDTFLVTRKGRGRGRGSDDGKKGGKGGGKTSGSGRSKPRIPGGSGCDDPGDVLEHPECGG